jgi:predicted phosphate transport protein (TIGR00153 family)
LLTNGEIRMVFLMPRQEKFFDLFDQAADILVSASERFLEMVSVFDRLPERAEELRTAEHDCDLIVEQILKALDRSFVTPMDREDIHALATSLDDVLDNMEETAYRLLAFRIERPTAAQVQMAHLIRDSCTLIAQAVRLCRTMKDPDQMDISLREIGRLENEADRIYRDTDARLFSDPPDILILIKMRELYAWLEETVDACREVAQVISGIVLKGA